MLTFWFLWYFVYIVGKYRIIFFSRFIGHILQLLHQLWPNNSQFVFSLQTPSSTSSGWYFVNHTFFSSQRFSHGYLLFFLSMKAIGPKILSLPKMKRKNLIGKGYWLKVFSLEFRPHKSFFCKYRLYFINYFKNCKALKIIRSCLPKLMFLFNKLEYKFNFGH